MNFANSATASKTLSTKEIIDHIFKDPSTTYELTEFENLGKPIHDIIVIYPKTTSAGRDAGKVKYFLKSFIPFSSGNEEVQVFVEGGKSAPEEIIRQLWIYKLINQYGYKQDEIDLEAGVQFGVEVGTKAADIIVYTDSAKDTPKIIVECKKPKRKDGIEQLKSYMNAKGAPVAVWSNGSDSIILYRPYPKNFDDTLFDIPKRGQEPKDVLEAKKTLLQLKRDFNFKKIIQDLEELVLADSGKDEFNEIFKLIFAKIWDEKEALENRKDKTVEFSKALDPDITFDRINGLFRKAGLGLDGLSFERPMGFVAKFSELEISLRSDAQHYQPRFDRLLAHLSKFPTRRIREIRRLNRRGIQPVYVGDGSHAVVNSQHLGPKHINYAGLERTTEKLFYATPEAHIRKDDLLIYTTGAYIGRTNVYLDDAPAFASNHVNILRLSPDIDHAYMAMVFQSIIGQFQTQKHARGSAQAELYPTDIDKFIVPLLPFEKQQEIGNLVRESLAQQRESARLLEQAKARVEQLIEEAVAA